MRPPVADDATDLPDETAIVGVENTDKQAGLVLQLQQRYAAPLDGTADELKDLDMWIARRVAEVLVTKYFGYMWRVVADSKQGVIYFSIPELMGPTLNYVIKLGQYSDLEPKLIARCGGELLERMGLPRGRADMAMLAEARKRMHTFDFSDVRH